MITSSAIFFEINALLMLLIFLVLPGCNYNRKCRGIPARNYATCNPKVHGGVCVYLEEATSARLELFTMAEKEDFKITPEVR